MERTKLAAQRWRLILFAAGIIASAVLLWDVIRALGMQLLAASLLMLLALPLCRHLEKRLPGGIAAAVSLAMLLVGAVLALMVIVPPVAGQVRALTESLPGLVQNLRGYLARFTGWLEGRGVDFSALRDGVFGRITEAAGGLVGRAMGMATSLIGNLSKVLLSPLMAFYLLRDRRKIAAGLTLLLPVGYRARGVRAVREM